VKITEVCIERPVFAWAIMLTTVLFGAMALTRLGVSQYPDVDFPTVSVGLTYEGAAPEIVEHDVIEPIEEALAQVEGIKTITATARQGSGSVTIELDLNRDVDAAVQEVQSRIAQMQNQLPRNMDPPTVSKTNPEDNPIMWVGLSGPYSRQVLTDYARYALKERLQVLPGVGEINMGGYTPRAVRIWVDALKLNQFGLTTVDVLNALRREHVEMPAGRLETEGREVNVRVFGEAMELSELRDVVIKDLGGTPVRLADVALIEDGFEDTRRLSRIAGEPAQGLGIRKQRGANALAVADAVHKALADLAPTFPEGMQARVMFDSTRFIGESAREVGFEILLAIILTSILCWMFLGSLSSTLNVILAIPMSLLGTIAVIYFLGYTLNTFTLLGLALAVGLVVDDAIMVLENIVRHNEMGKDRVTAARDGTKQITFAALSATIAIVAIFVPVVFLKGVLGKYLMQFGVTLSVAILLSYLEAITLAPARCAQFLRTHDSNRNVVGRGVDALFAWSTRVYVRLLRYTVRHPVVVILVAVGVTVGAWYSAKALPFELVPSQDQGRLMVRIQTNVSANLGEMDALMQRVEGVVNARPDVKRAFCVVGGFGGSGVNTGMMFVTLAPKDEREKSQQQVMGEMRGAISAIPGVKVFIMDLSSMGMGGGGRSFPIEFSVRGPEWEPLAERSEEIRRGLQQAGLVTDLDSDYQLGMPEVRIDPDRARAADLGVSMEDIGTAIGALVGGVRAGKYSADGRRVDVRVRLLADQRTRPEDLGRIYVRSKSGQLVPLTSLVTYEERAVLQSITRKERERAITLTGNPAPGHSQGEVLAEIERIGRTLPPGYRVVVGGVGGTMKESFVSFLQAFVLGILFAFLVLASQFNSWRFGFTVMTILVPSMAGAMYALWVTGYSLNMFSIIGLLLVTGIVKKNSIILVDYGAERMRAGVDRVTAMLEAGQTRLRPIIMTSLATAAAAVPAALALGPGAEMRAPMAMAVLGGVALSSTLSLLVVPAVFVLIAPRRRPDAQPVAAAVPEAGA
jgi:multidrug efflux pump